MDRLPLRRVLFGVVPLVGLGYAVHLVGPLRLTHDATLLLTTAASLAEGRGFPPGGTPHPPGYPMALAALDVLGLSHPAAILLLNQLLLGVGLIGAWHVLRSGYRLDPPEAATICLLTVLSWGTVLFASMPFTDVPYMGLSLAGLGCFAVVERRLREGVRAGPGLLTAGLAFGVAAAATRAIGVALVLPVGVIAWGWLRARRRTGTSGRGTAPLALAVALVLAGLLTLGWRSLRVYSGFQPLYFLRLRPGDFLLANLRSKVAEWGELALDIPVSKLIVNTPVTGQVPYPLPVWVAVALAGGLSLVLAVRGLAVLARRSPCVTWYLLAYGGILAVWLTDDPRLWVPVLPLAMGAVLLGMRQVLGADRARPLLRGWALAFAAVGLLGLGWSARAALSRDAFLDLYNGRRAEREVYERFLDSPDGPPERSWDRAQLWTWRALQRYGR